MQINKYQELIDKIQIAKQINPSNFTSSELELIANALEAIQFLEIFFKQRLRKLETIQI